MTILPQLESELLGAHARRAARRRRWRRSSPATPGALAVVLGVTAAIAVAVVAIVLIRHSHGSVGGGNPPPAGSATPSPPGSASPPPGSAPPPPAGLEPPPLPSKPTRDQQREEQYIFRAQSAVSRRCSRGPTSPIPQPTVSQGAPSQALLSILGVLRRPAQPTDKLPTRVVGLDHQVIPNGSLPPAKDIYVRYIRRARWRFGAGYYIVPADDVNVQAPPVRPGCATAQQQALQRELPQIPKRLRTPTLALEQTFLAQMRYESEPREGICLLALNSTGGGDVQCGSTATDIEQGHTTGTGGPTGVPVAYGVIPDGVATVTLHYGRRAFTVHAIGNVWILPLHGRQPQYGFPDKTVWRSAAGAVIKTIQGP